MSYQMVLELQCKLTMEVFKQENNRKIIKSVNVLTLILDSGQNQRLSWGCNQNLQELFEYHTIRRIKMGSPLITSESIYPVSKTMERNRFGQMLLCPTGNGQRQKRCYGVAFSVQTCWSDMLPLEHSDTIIITQFECLPPALLLMRLQIALFDYVTHYVIAHCRPFLLTTLSGASAPSTAVISLIQSFQLNSIEGSAQHSHALIRLAGPSATDWWSCV